MSFIWVSLYGAETLVLLLILTFLRTTLSLSEALLPFLAEMHSRVYLVLCLFD